jgi:hypothetical protein
MDRMLQSLFLEVDVDNSGHISVDEYKAWAVKNPELTNFLKDLHVTTFSGVSKAAGVEKRKVRRDSVERIQGLKERLSVSGPSDDSDASGSVRASGSDGAIQPGVAGLRLTSNPKLRNSSQVSSGRLQVVSVEAGGARKSSITVKGDVGPVVEMPNQEVDHRPSNPRLIGSKAVSSFRGISNKAMSNRDLSEKPTA